MSAPGPDHAPAPPRPSAEGWLSPGVPFAPRRIPFFYGWVVLAAATIGVACSAPGQTMGFTAFTDILMERMGLSRLQISLAYGVGTGVSGFLLTRAGRYFDRHGARRTILLSGLLLGVALAYLSVCDWVRWLPLTEELSLAAALVSMSLGFFLARFFGQGVLTMSSRAMLSKWFNARRGLAINISGVLVAGAFSAAPRFFDELITHLGWRGAYLAMGVGVAAVAGLTGWLLARDNPEECGLEMDGGPVPEAKKVNVDLVMRREFTRGEAMRTYSFWVTNLLTSWFAMLVTAVSFHLLAVGAEESMARGPVLELFLPMGLVSIISSFFFAWWSDRTRMKWVMMTGSLAIALYALGGYLFPDAIGRVLFVVGGGLAGSSFQTTTGVVWARFYGRRELGAISGVNMAWIVVASALGPVCFHALALLGGNFEFPLLLASFVGVGLAISCFWAENPQRRIEPEA